MTFSEVAVIIVSLFSGYLVVSTFMAVNKVKASSKQHHEERMGGCNEQRYQWKDAKKSDDGDRESKGYGLRQ